MVKFLITKNTQIRELARKANKAIRKIWEIGERKIGHDFSKRMRMFDNLISCMLIYKTEVWGRKQHEEIERECEMGITDGH